MQVSLLWGQKRGGRARRGSLPCLLTPSMLPLDTDESFARVVLAPQDVVVARNEEAMFHCQFSAQPPPSLQWFFEDETPISNRSR